MNDTEELSQQDLEQAAGGAIDYGVSYRFEITLKKGMSRFEIMEELADMEHILHLGTVMRCVLSIELARKAFTLESGRYLVSGTGSDFTVTKCAPPVFHG